MNKYTKKQLEVLIALKEGMVLEHWYDRGRFGKSHTYLRKSGHMDRTTVRNDYYDKFATDNLITQVSRDPWSADFKISKKGLELLEQAD